MTVKTLVTTCALLTIALTAALRAAPDPTAQSTDPVIQWNRNLLAIVRTPGAQAATIHPTRSFAILHAAIYDASTPSTRPTGRMPSSSRECHSRHRNPLLRTPRHTRCSLPSTPG